MLLTTALALAAPPMLDVSVGLEPAGLASIQVPAKPGESTHRVTSGITWDATLTVSEGPLGLELHVALEPVSQRLRGVKGRTRRPLSMMMRSETWLGQFGDLVLPLPVAGQTAEMFTGGEIPTRDGTFTPYGIKVVVAEARS